MGSFTQSHANVDSQNDLNTDPTYKKVDEWGMSTESINNVNNVELVGAGGRYEKKVIKTEMQLASGRTESDRLDDNKDLEW